MSTWTDRLASSKLRTFTDGQGHFWLEQNPEKRSKWAKLARDGHNVAWEFERRGLRKAPRCAGSLRLYQVQLSALRFLRLF